MKKHIYSAFIVLLTMILISCDTDKWYQVSPEASDYVERFEAMAEKRGYDIDIEESGLIIEFSSIEEDLNSKLYYEDPIRIVIDENAWNNFNDELKALEIYRNLALGFLNRQTLNEKFPNGEWKSIMRGEVFCEGDNENLNFFGFRQDYYINELFYIETEIPWWADYASTYDSIRIENANEVVAQDISLDDLEWDYISSGMNINFENGELILENSQSEPGHIIVQLADLSSTDFLIETIIKIENSKPNCFNGLIWGASDQRSFYVNAYNPQSEIRMYNSAEDYNYCYFTSDSASIVIPDGYNKISIRKEGDKFHYFMNEKFIYITDIHKLYGDKFGFYLGGESKIHINRLSIKTE